MLQIPNYLTILFIATTIITMGIFYLASNRSKKVLMVSFIWLTLQLIISLTGFYKDTYTLPPRFVFLIGPPFIFIAILFITKNGRKYLNRFNIKTLTLLHTVRIPVEICLLLLFTHKMLPEILTFEGRNFDIISGITASIIGIIAFRNKKTSHLLLLIWNFICVGLLVNIVTHAILATPTVFQKIAFDQPNIAIFHFPFVWLPGYIVPVVLLSHLISIRHMILEMRSKKKSRNIVTALN